VVDATGPDGAGAGPVAGGAVAGPPAGPGLAASGPAGSGSAGPVAPSGRQLELRHGALAATITEIGGGLRRLRVGQFDLLDGYELTEMASRGRGQLLLPWPNRVRGGRYTFAGTTYQLPINEPALGNASHGLTRWCRWDLRASSDSAGSATCLLPAQSGYPFTVAFAVDYRLDDDGLTVTMTATNSSDRPAPVGMGAHPYFRLPGPDGPGGRPARADEMTLRLAGHRRLVADAALIPVADVPVDDPETGGAAFDFRTGRAIGPTVVDTCYTDIDRDAAGRAEAVLAAPGGARVTVWFDETWPYLQVFTGDTLSESERRRSVAIEPLTCPADAFNSGTGLRVLEPGESFGGSWGITPDI